MISRLGLSLRAMPGSVAIPQPGSVLMSIAHVAMEDISDVHGVGCHLTSCDVQHCAELALSLTSHCVQKSWPGRPSLTSSTSSNVGTGELTPNCTEWLEMEKVMPSEITQAPKDKAVWE